MPLLNHKIDGDGPNVVFLHPIGLDLTCWDDVVKALGRRYRALRVDLRGHGSSPAAAPGTTLADYAEDVHALLSQLKFTPTAVVGLSFGGMITQELGLAHPEDTSRQLAERLGCSLSTVKRHLRRARESAPPAPARPVVPPTITQVLDVFDELEKIA